MNGARFDGLTRALARGTSRRTVIATGLAALAGAGGILGAEASKNTVTSTGVRGAVADESPTVTIDTGTLQGTIEDGMAVYRGIPYAAPPVGPLRWRPPQPPAAWEGVRDATKFAAACPQPPVNGVNADIAAGSNEDCLHLNVYAPEQPGKDLPVMVWIHGGALIEGAASEAMYTPINLVKNGVIVVTIDYRLGMLGYFAPQQLIDEAAAAGEPVGNYGTMDQIESLKWVKRNIAAFGGDPDNVTIFGQSGGGRTVTWLMLSPLARGLFHRAIAQAARMNPLPAMTEAVHGMTAQVDLAAKVVAGLGVSSMEELRALPTEKVVFTAAQYQAGEYGGAFIDGQLIPGDPVKLFSEGKQAPVPFMIGTNSWDSGFFTLSAQPDDFATYLTSIGLDPATVAPLYADIPACLQVTDAEGDAWYLGGVKMVAGAMQGVAPGYAYYFDHVTEKVAKPYPGAMHQWEIPFAFGSIGLVQQPAQLDVAGLDSCDIANSGDAEMKKGDFPATYLPTADASSPEDIALSEEVSAFWATFARTGNPNAEGAEWPIYDPAQDVIMSFTDKGEPVANILKARVDPQVGMMEKVFGVKVR